MGAEDHAHGHAREQDHAHVHAASGATEERQDAAFSLLRLSAAQRLGIVLVLVLALWAGVRWALS
jgi:hypothetical protein